MGYTYRDVPCLKSPIDLAIYWRLIWELKPGLIVEIGAKAGGSALLFADILQVYGLESQVLSIDLNPPKTIQHDRITFVRGDVHSLADLLPELESIEHSRPWLVIEDSAHTYRACLAALEFFSGVMRSGDILVIEDGVLRELGLARRYSGGPNRALEKYFADHPHEFEVMEELCDMFGTNATYNPNGYLRRR